MLAPPLSTCSPWPSRRSLTDDAAERKAVQRSASRIVRPKAFLNGDVMCTSNSSARHELAQRARRHLSRQELLCPTLTVK
mmetsp:Transcript_25324/g.41371  ORF Transcript_25324/g.41371 Transcript_25324/m.41371 type:complete len:80 (-) Transcript_25324:473-712(-)